MHARDRISTRKWLLLAVVAALALGALTGCGLFAADKDTSADSNEGGVAQSPGISPVPPTVTDEGLAGGEEGRSSTEPGFSGAGEDASKVPAEDRLIIRTAGVRVRVDDVDAAVGDVRALATQFGGSITALQVSTDDETPVYDYMAQGSLADGVPLSGFITVRVPAARLAEFTGKIAELGTVLQESSGESDVTQEHVDLTARLKNLQAQEARLRDFFDAAKKVDEMLAIEQELGRVRGEIEAMQAQIAYLERQAAMATVTIQLVRPEPLISGEEERSGFREALKDGLDSAVSLLQYALTVLIATSPLWIPAGIVVIIIIAVRRSRRARWAAMQPPAPLQTTESQQPIADEDSE